MAFYEHFYSDGTSITALGKKIVARENLFYVSLLKKFLPHGALTVCEIGVGKGDFAKACRTFGWRFSGIEANVGQADHLRKEGFNVQAGLVPPIPYLDKSFDAVFANQVIEHMPTAEHAIQFVGEINRILKPSGVVLLGAPDYFMYKEGFYDNDYTHNYVTTVARLTQLLGDQGFRILHTDYITMSLRGNFVTFLISQLTRFAYWTRLPYLLPEVWSHKIRYSLLRGFFILARKP